MARAFDLDSIREKLSSRRKAGALLETPAARAELTRGIETGENELSSAGPVQAFASGNPEERRAAVAAILRPTGRETEVLLIRRAERAGDPWSGHMAFPGGHQDPEDSDLFQTAMRETFEEVGLDLSEHEHLGQLDLVPATLRGRRVGISIAPHVFALRAAAPVLRPNGEVAEIVWAELGPMARGELDAIKEWTYAGESRQVPCYRVHGHIVWGLTYHMLRSLFAVLE
ncbi:MAG TPA: CoA pyrophosphatase [Polyangiales bacterium]|nr:CoA pyrophosphatase [Polyangiales bacterium]